MQSQQQFSILLVDDDPMVVRVLSRILAEFTPLRFATSGRVALELARESVPDLVLLDVEMPEMSGFEVCKEFKSDLALAQVPIIFVTSHESPQLEAKGLQLGAADFISKPPHAALVIARVRTYQHVKKLSDTLSGGVTMDFLTGAITRRKLEKTLALEWLRAQRSAKPLAILIADIDEFEAYNAEFGEEQGDKCLRSIADGLRLAMRRPSDILGRYAGGKFALLLPDTDAAGAEAVAKRAIAAVDALQMRAASSKGRDRVSLSVGGGFRRFLHPSRKNDAAEQSTHRALLASVPDDLIAAATRALASARSAGGHQVRFVELTNVT